MSRRKRSRAWVEEQYDNDPYEVPYDEYFKPGRKWEDITVEEYLVYPDEPSDGLYQAVDALRSNVPELSKGTRYAAKKAVTNLSQGLSERERDALAWLAKFLITDTRKQNWRRLSCVA